MRNLRVNQRCWLIAEPQRHAPRLAAQFAQLRSLEVREASTLEAVVSSTGDAAALIATSLAAVNRMTSRERETLRASDERRRHTLHSRRRGGRSSLSPRAVGRCVIHGGPTCRGSRVSIHRSRNDPGGLARRGSSAWPRAECRDRLERFIRAASPRPRQSRLRIAGHVRIDGGAGRNHLRRPARG